MPLNFPSSPSLNEIYSSGGNSWIWSGNAWKTYNSSFDASLVLNGDLIFEGATNNNYETTVSVVDPDQDRTITLPNASGTVGLVPGSDTYVVFNDGGSLGGDSGLTYNKLNDTLTVGSGSKNIQIYSESAGGRLVVPGNTSTELIIQAGTNGAGSVKIGDHDNSNQGTKIIVNDSSQTIDIQGTLSLTSPDGNYTNTFPTGFGSNGQVLTTNGSGTLSWSTASGGGGSGTKTYAVFTPLNNQPPASAYATLDTRNSIMVLDFDAASDESALFVGIMPEGASLGSGLKIRIHWMATSATSGTCRWGVQLERMNTDADADSFDTAATAGTATNATSGIATVTEITITTIDSIAAGELFRLKVYRDADGTSGTDDMIGDAELVAVEVRSAS